MAATEAELEWLKKNMGREVDEKTRGLALDQMVTDKCAEIVDGQIFATRKGQRLFDHYQI